MPLATLTGQTLLITARHAGQTVILDGTVAATAAVDGQQLRVHGSGDVDLGAGWWDQLGIFDGNYTGDWFDGDTPATVDPVEARIERSDNDGGTWTPIADGLPLGAGIGDDEVPLNRDPLYRAVSISDLGVENPGDPVTVHTGTSRVWLRSELGKLFLYGDVNLAPFYGHERVLEDYWEDDYPTAHYGRGQTERVQVSGTWHTAEERAQDPRVVLGRDVFYRDPAGRAWWGSVDAMQGGQPWAGQTDWALTVERTTHG